MKKIKILTGVFVLVSCLLGCNRNILDKLPDNLLSKEEAFKDPQLVSKMVNDLYNVVPKYMDGYFFFQMLASLSDESVDAQGQFTAAEWNRGVLSLTYNPLELHATRLNMWNHYWQGIRNANLFLENIDLAPIEDSGASNAITSVQKRMWIAEVRLLRAFFHMELIKYYGGVIISDHTFPPDLDFTTLTRNTFDECAQWIADECDAVLADLPVRRKQSGGVLVAGVGKMTQMIALAIKARTLLYNASPLHNPTGDTEKWRQAANASKAVLDLAAQSGEYDLYKKDDPSNGGTNLYQLFQLPDNGTSEMAEVIWQKPGNNGHFTNINAIRNANGGRAGACPTQELVDAFETISGHPPILGYADEDHLQPILNPDAIDYDESNPFENRDPRLTAYIYYNGAYWGKKGTTDYYVQAYTGGIDQIASAISSTKTGYYIKKFTDPTRGNGTVSNANPPGNAYWPIFRLAEFYLSYAEATNEVNGPTDDAIEAVNAVRNRAGMPDLHSEYIADKDAFRTRILNERRIELAFEEHRFFDVRRWKMLASTDRVATGMSIDKDGDDFTYERILVQRRQAYSDRYLLMPIPISEMNSMPNYGQNPGWE